MNKFCKHCIMLILASMGLSFLTICTVTNMTIFGLIFIVPTLIALSMAIYAYRTNMCCDVSNIIKEQTK